jgi:hypothetical protein
VSDTIPPDLRQQIVEQSRSRCAYCQTQAYIIGAGLTVDHIIPRVLGGQTILENLCLACWECNLIKGVRTQAVDPLTGAVVPLFHPNRQKWSDHFRWSADNVHVIGITSIGRAGVALLRLNRSQLVTSRRFWVQAGWRPPQD